MPANCRLPLFVQAINYMWFKHINHTGNLIHSLNELTLDNIWMYDWYLVRNVFFFQDAELRHRNPAYILKKKDI